MAIELVSETFANRVGERFTATPAEGEALELVLSSCTESPYPGPGERTPFSLLFHAPGPNHVPQQSFTLSHRELGDFALFMVPLGPSELGATYEAVIS